MTPKHLRGMEGLLTTIEMKEEQPCGVTQDSSVSWHSWEESEKLILSSSVSQHGTYSLEESEKLPNHSNIITHP